MLKKSGEFSASLALSWDNIELLDTAVIGLVNVPYESAKYKLAKDVIGETSNDVKRLPNKIKLVKLDNPVPSNDVNWLFCNCKLVKLVGKTNPLNEVNVLFSKPK